MVCIPLVFLIAAQVGSPPFEDPARAQLTPIPNNAANDARRIEEIHKLIQQLNADEFKARLAATKKLKAMACDELDLIKQATSSLDPEIAQRAKVLVDGFTYSHIVADAVGNPIPAAKVTIPFPDGQQELVTDACGHLNLDRDHRQLLFQSSGPSITVSHEDYGVAVGDAFPGFNRMPGRQPVQTGPQRMINNVISIPLVNRHSDARSRSVKGKVVRDDGTPVANARVICDVVRTPGMGLMQAGDTQTVIANAKGEFSLYLDQRRGVNRALPSKLIPPNSKFSIEVQDPDGKLFPWGGSRSNRATEPIVLKKPDRKFNVRFMDDDGQEIDPRINASVVVRYHSDDLQCALDINFVMHGWLLPGRYSATRRLFNQRKGPTGKEYVPVTIDDTTGDEVVFEVKKARQIHGSVVDAKMGKPIPNAIVVTLCSTSETRLTDLTDDDWTLLEQQPANFSEDALKLLQNVFGREMTATKSDEAGNFVIAEAAAGTMHSVVAFTRTTVPMRESWYCIDKRLRDDGGNPRFTLYPAAYVTLRPKQGVAVQSTCRWLIHEATTPELTELLTKTARNSNEQYAHYSTWVPRDKPFKMMVPANTRLQVRLSPSSGSSFSDRTLPQEIHLKPGEHLELAPYDFQPRTPLTVRVVDKKGKPVEGVAVRTSSDGHRFSISINTNVNGVAVCMVDRDSGGVCRVGGLFHHSKIPNADKLRVKFNVGNTAKEPLVIAITQPQIDAILNEQ